MSAVLCLADVGRFLSSAKHSLIIGKQQVKCLCLVGASSIVERHTDVHKHRDMDTQDTHEIFTIKCARFYDTAQNS